jgi:hypothetical protein
VSNLDVYAEAPSGLNIYLDVNADPVVQVPGAAVMLGTAGAPGVAASTVMPLGLSGSLTPGATVSMNFEVAGTVPATVARSKAYTSTPPVSSPVTIGLLDNGVQFGTATWAVGQHQGVLSFNNPTAPFVDGDIPGFQLPSPLDAAFTQFAITYAS